MTFNTMAALRGNTTPPAPNEVADLLGFWAPGDAGGGSFIWNSASMEEDNGGTIIRPGNVLPTDPGRWERRYEELINVRWFGAKGDNTNDDTASLQAAITASSIAGTNCFVPEGIYATTKPLILWGSSNIDTTGGVVLIGASKKGAVIRKKTHTVYGAENWPVTSRKDLLGNIDAVIITERRSATGSETACNWGLRDITIDSAPPGLHASFPKNSDRVDWGVYTFSAVGARVTDVVIKATKCFYLRTVYVCDFNQMYLNGYTYGFYMDGVCTSINIRSSYVVGIINAAAGIAWHLKGRYMSCNNLAADGNLGTVYKFLDWTGAISGIGSESREAMVIFDFDGSTTTVDGFTVSRPFHADAVIFRIARSKVKVNGGFFAWTTSFLQGLPPAELALPRNWLYQTTPGVPPNANPSGSLELSNIHMTFFSPSGTGTDNVNYFKTPDDRTRTTAFNIKIENISNNVNSGNQGALQFKSGEIMPYLGRDNRGVAASKVYADVSYFTKALFLDCEGTPATGKLGSYAAIEAPNVGDVFFENTPAANGAFGWICTTKGTNTGTSQYLKVPVLLSGAATARPTANLVAGQDFFNTTTGKKEVYNGTAWVDGNAGSVNRTARTVATAITVNGTDHTLFVNNTVGENIQLPDAAANAGRVLVLKKTSNTAAATIIPAAGQMVDGGANIQLANINDKYTLQSDGANWWVIG